MMGLWALGITLLTLAGGGPAAPSFQELMDPSVFPDPQRGLTVEAVARHGAVTTIRTTGAEIVLDARQGLVRFSQRIGRHRRVATLRFGTALQGAAITHAGPGFARITVTHPAMTIRINGDSLFMLHVHEPVTASLARAITPAWNASYQNNHLLADEWGAVGLYCSDPALNDCYNPFEKTVASYPLPADAVLWVGVCPPKSYDWEQSLKGSTIWHWSDQSAYPDDATLRSWKPYGDTVLLQSELMLWKDWNLDFVPRLGPDEFARVRQSLHNEGMRFIVYTSPYYFLKGTAREAQAVNTFEGFTGWPAGSGSGDNMELFLAAIARVMKQYQPDGLYFDGQYLDNPAALYALARRARVIVGENGILEWHSTDALGSANCYLPQADAYVDVILRGEGQGTLYRNRDYLRFFVSGYNINNCIGVVCNNAAPGLTSELIRDALAVNARFHVLAGSLSDAKSVALWRDEYRAKLTPALRTEVETQINAHQSRVLKQAKTARAEQAQLAAPPRWATPGFTWRGAAWSDAERVRSALNPDPFSLVDKALHIRARASTYAYLRVPLALEAGGFVAKLRQGDDGGMSWGPAALIRWADGTVLRVGTRGDGLLQADLGGRQLVGGSHNKQQWTWLRVRWYASRGVIECSADGVQYDPVWRFEHGGNLNGPTAELLVGKVPFNGQAQDFSDPGPVGECDIAFVDVYGRTTKPVGK